MLPRQAFVVKSYIFISVVTIVDSGLQPLSAFKGDSLTKVGHFYRKVSCFRGFSSRILSTQRQDYSSKCLVSPNHLHIKSCPISTDTPRSDFTFAVYRSQKL